MGPLRSIGQIRVNVQDIARAVAFYRDVLGMTLLYEMPDQRMAFFECGGVRLYLAQDSSSDTTSTAAVYYTVEGLDQVYSELVDRGATVINPPATVYRIEQVEGRMAFLHDSEGNTVGLMEEKPVNPV
jgi:predicted enzyme related to lactoylglutathione lyase